MHIILIQVVKTWTKLRNFNLIDDLSILFLTLSMILVLNNNKFIKK